MKVPDNFILLLLAMVLIGLGYLVPETSAAAKMLAQLWAVVLLMVQAGEDIFPSRKEGLKPESQQPEIPKYKPPEN